jgi:signal transduction histidine kinase/CheY-like chemotaxis protein
MTAITAVTLFVCAGFLAAYDSFTFRNQQIHELAVEAKVLGANCSAALANRDHASAEEMLLALSTYPHIRMAAVYDQHGNMFAEYRREDLYRHPPTLLKEIGTSNIRNDFISLEPIVLRGQSLGALYIEASDDEYVQRAASYLTVIVVMTALATLTAVGVAGRTLKLIFGPIRRLTHGMDAIAANKDYSVRVGRESDLEVGHLVDAFNGMLEEIEARDKGLERRVMERTEALSNEIASKELAEKHLAAALTCANAASEAKSQFLANMSHEIRTPMNGVIGMTEVLLGTNLDERQVDSLLTIKGCAEGLLRIINDVLEFSKMDAGKLELTSEPFSIEEIVGQVGAMFAVAAASQQLELVCWCSPETPTMLRGDPGRLRQVMINLVGNALKFTDQGGVWLDVSVIETHGDRASLRIAVRDSGIGISEEHQNQIFLSFTQADGSLARKQGGTGLGLTISKQLIGLMGGSLSVDSQLGKGSTFTADVEFEVLRSSSQVSQIEGKRVLVATPSAELGTRLFNLFKFHGGEPVLATTGSEAKAMILDFQFDFAILDASLPELNGWQVAKAAAGATIKTEIFLLTDRDDSVPGSSVARQWTSGVISKPFQANQLCRALTAEKMASTVNTTEQMPLRQWNGWKILLVEDNAINAKVATQLLLRLGCDVDHAENGLVALDCVEQTSYDLIFMDIQMPMLNGLETARRIRASHDRRVRNVTIVAMTANAMSGDRDLCLEAGMNDYLAKPISMQGVTAILEKWLIDSSIAA